MIDIIKKTVLTGVGLAAMTREKVEEFARELAEKEKLSEEDGRDLLDDLVKRLEEAKKDLAEQVERLVKDMTKKMNLATRDELLNLREQVNKLEQALKEKDPQG